MDNKGQGFIPVLLLLLISVIVVGAITTDVSIKEFNQSEELQDQETPIDLIAENLTGKKETNDLENLTEEFEFDSSSDVDLIENPNNANPIDTPVEEIFDEANETFNEIIDINDSTEELTQLNESLVNITYLNNTITVLNETFNFSVSLNETFNLSLNLNSTNITEINQTINLSQINKTFLAKIFNEDNLVFDRDYLYEYLEDRKNFSDLDFKNITVNDKLTLKYGAVLEPLSGIKINDENFAIEVMGCNSYERYCTFRINGVPTKKLYSLEEFQGSRKPDFDLDDDYKLTIENIVFDYCDGQRFCSLGYESYNIIDVKIKSR